MSDARRAAEAAMLPFRDGPHLTTKVTAEEVWNLAVAMDALLAEQGAGGANPDIPDSCRVDEDGCCLVCGRDVEGCYACSHAAGLPLAPPPAPEAALTPDVAAAMNAHSLAEMRPAPSDAAVPAPEDVMRDIAEAETALRWAGVPEQLPPLKAPRAPIGFRIMWLSARAAAYEHLHAAVAKWCDDHARSDAKMRAADIELVHSYRSLAVDVHVAQRDATLATAPDAAVREAADIAESAPELNLNNYDHEQGRELTDAMVAVTLKLRAALAARGERWE